MTPTQLKEWKGGLEQIIDKWEKLPINKDKDCVPPLLLPNESGWTMKKELLQWFESKLEKERANVITEVIESVQENHKGTFTDDGGNDCWYIEDLVKALKHMLGKSNKLKGTS